MQSKYHNKFKAVGLRTFTTICIKLWVYSTELWQCCDL